MRPSATPAATSPCGRCPPGAIHSSSTNHNGTVAQSSDVSPDGTHCSAQHTVAVPPTTSNAPAIVAARHSAHAGRGAPRHHAYSAQDRARHHESGRRRQHRRQRPHRVRDREIRGAPDDVDHRESRDHLQARRVRPVRAIGLGLGVSCGVASGIRPRNLSAPVAPRRAHTAGWQPDSAGCDHPPAHSLGGGVGRCDWTDGLR